MMKKISRRKCFELYPQLAHFEENSIATQNNFFYPEVYAGYVLTCQATNIQHHIEVFVSEITHVTKAFGYEYLLFIPNEDTPWIKDPGDIPALQEGLNFLIEHHIEPEFDGGLKVSVKLLPEFLKHIMAMACYHDLFPTINFMDDAQNFMCSICGHGNIHVEILNPAMYDFCLDAISKTRLKMVDRDQCAASYASPIAEDKHQVAEKIIL